jgi:hypothetical protein
MPLYVGYIDLTPAATVTSDPTLTSRVYLPVMRRR